MSAPHSGCVLAHLDVSSARRESVRVQAGCEIHHCPRATAPRTQISEGSAASAMHR